MNSLLAASGRWLACAGLLLQTACSSFSDIESESPTLQMLRGDLHPEDYREALTAANERDRAREAFERNRDPSRAFNTKTERFEYLPQDTEQEWNPATERWEFTPVNAEEN